MNLTLLFYLLRMNPQIFCANFSPSSFFMSEDSKRCVIWLSECYTVLLYVIRQLSVLGVVIAKLSYICTQDSCPCDILPCGEIPEGHPVLDIPLSYLMV